MKIHVHPSAVIDAGAQIGEGTRVWHFTHIMEGARIGKNCVLGQNTFVANGVVLGDNVRVQNNVSIYEGVVCDNDVFIGPSVVFTNVINPRSFVNRKDEFQKTIVHKGVSIGANATILCGIHIGAHAFIGAGTVITKNVDNFALMVGNPGKHIGWMSRSGYRLSFDTYGRAICPSSREEYVLEGGLCILKSSI